MRKLLAWMGLWLARIVVGSVLLIALAVSALVGVAFLYQGVLGLLR